MNELLRSVLTRRSIHKFDARQISDRELNEIIEAGKFVSSVIKNQAWHFTVVQNKEVLEYINSKNNQFFLTYGHDLFKENYHDDHFNFLRKAPTLIIISGVNNDNDTQDAASAAFGNMMLAGEKIGIGACWTPSVKLLFDSPEGRSIATEISIPPDYTPLCAGVFGYKMSLQEDLGVVKDGFVHIIK